MEELEETDASCCIAPYNANGCFEWPLFRKRISLLRALEPHVQPRHFACCVVVSRAGKKRPAGKSGPNLIPGTVPGNQFLLLRRGKWRL
ncbi:MAG: hypothetical protein ACI83P_002665 [Janthinobacterium sp.]